MPTLPTAEWTATLDRMTAAITTSLADLDRYEAQWSALHDAPAAATSPDQLFAWLERRLGAWDAQLTEAASLAASVATQLGERETALGRWHELFLRWRDLIQREVAPPTTSGGANESE
jgi:hypothetical protein